MYKQPLIEPFAELMKIPNLLGGTMSCSWWRTPIHSSPLPASNCPPFDSYPLHPLVFFVRDKYKAFQNKKLG